MVDFDSSLSYCCFATKERVRERPKTYVGQTTIYTFGFGKDHNADMLKEISDTGNGMYYFIETNDKVGGCHVILIFLSLLYHKSHHVRK